MARPKENIFLGEAFEQKCQREKDRLKEQNRKLLKNDMIRLLTEDIHPDVNVTDGCQTVSAHRFILYSRAGKVFEKLKVNKGENDDIATIMMPPSNFLQLKEFNKQLYYTETVDSLLDEVSIYPVKSHSEEISNFSQNSTENLQKCVKSCCEKNINFFDDLTHNKCDKQDNCADRSETKNNGEISLSDVQVQLNTSENLISDVEICSLSSESTSNSNQNDVKTHDSENNLLCEKENVVPYSKNSSDTSLTNLIKLSYSLSLPHETCSCLGDDLLRGFLQEKCCDCSLVVAGQQFKAHRCMLSARSEYFEAMLGGKWKESGIQNIELEGINPGAIEQALLYLYGGVIDIIETCNIPDLLLVGDMYGMIGLKDVACFQIKKDYCHFFHKPCSSCLSMAGDALTLAVTYNLDDLKERCVKWINKYFTKFWSSRSFASQHEDILRLCCDNLISQISEQNVVDIIMDTHKLSGNLPHVKWSEPILHLLTQLMNSTISFISQNFISVMGSKQFLCWEKGAAWNASILEDIFGTVIESLSPSNGCQIYQALLRLDEYNESLDDSTCLKDLNELVKFLLKKCETYLRINIHQVTLTEDWVVLPENIRTKILNCASYVCMDNNKIRKRPPKLNSNRKAKVPGAVIQSLREEHKFKNTTAELQRNKKQVNSQKSNISKSEQTDAKQFTTGAAIDRPSAARSESSSTAISESSSTARSESSSTARSESSSTARSESSSTARSESLPSAVGLDELQKNKCCFEERKHLTKLKLQTSAIPRRQISWSPDPESATSSPSSISPRSDSRIPIHRSSSLSPFQGTSPDVHRNGFFAPLKKATNEDILKDKLPSEVKIENDISGQESLIYPGSIETNQQHVLHSNESGSRRSMVINRSCRNGNPQNEFEVENIEMPNLLPLFEVEFHKPPQFT